MKRGSPIAGTGRRGNMGMTQNHGGKPNGVMGASRIIPHRYHDELDKGPKFRRQIRKIEKRMWRAEIFE